MRQLRLTRWARSWTAVISLGILGCGAGEPLVWERYEYPEDGFSVEFPGEPEIVREEVENDLAPMFVHTFTRHGERETLRYQVIMRTIPLAVFGLGFKPSQLVEARIKNYAHAESLEILTDTGWTLGDVGGRALTFEHPDGSLEQSRLLMRKTVMHHVSVRGPAEERGRSEIPRFLDSFRLLGESPS